MNAPEDEILALPTALFPRRTRARVGAGGEPEIHKQSVKGVRRSQATADCL